MAPIGLEGLVRVDGDEGEEGMAVVEEVQTTAERTIIRLGGAAFEGAVLRDSMLGVDRLPPRWTADLGEGEGEVEGVGWVEGEDLEEWIREASRVTFVAEGLCIIRWTRLSTLRSDSGVS